MKPGAKEQNQTFTAASSLSDKHTDGWEEKTEKEGFEPSCRNTAMIFFRKWFPSEAQSRLNLGCWRGGKSVQLILAISVCGAR